MNRMNVSAEVLHTLLTQEIRKLSSETQWGRWLDAAALFPTYGFGNAVLITLQMPQANFIAAASAWERLGRRVVRGGAIKILAPVRSRVLFEDEGGEPTMDPQGSIRQGVIGFKVANVWDVAHTVGPPVSLPAVVSRGADDKLWDALRRDAQSRGFTVEVRWTQPEQESYTDHRSRRIVISNQIGSVARIGRLAHEVGHVRMHSRSEECDGLAELEADSFAHITLARFGLPLDTASFGSVLLRAAVVEPRSPESVVKTTGTRALVAARRFLEATGQQLTPSPRVASKGVDAKTMLQLPSLSPEL